MADFPIVRGFEEAWRPPAGRRRRPEEVLHAPTSRAEFRARLARIVAKSPEVMVKVTGRTKSAQHLRAHLDYISRKGELPLEGQEWPLLGREEVRELAEDWSAIAEIDRRRRANTPLSHSLVLSMPEGTDAYVVRDAAHAFAQQAFGERFDYVFALHTDEPHPHVHIAIRSRGNAGERLNPKKADLEEWRQIFARALRERGVEAEATPRRARGITRKPERGPLRRIRERAEAGRGPVGRVQRAQLVDAARAAFGGETELKPWQRRLAEKQRRIRAIYLAQARMLQGSGDEKDQALGRAVEAFVHQMPPPDSQRLALARMLREQNARLRRERGDDRHTRQR